MYSCACFVYCVGCSLVRGESARFHVCMLYVVCGCLSVFCVHKRLFRVAVARRYLSSANARLHTWAFRGVPGIVTQPRAPPKAQVCNAYFVRRAGREGLCGAACRVWRTTLILGKTRYIIIGSS